MFKVIIAGSRNFHLYNLLKETMDYYLSNIEDEITVVCGKARGADILGEKYAIERGYNITYYPANWDKYGKRAGMLRNEEMAKNADALVAFWDGESKGTKNMIAIAQKYNLKIRVKHFDDSTQEYMGEC